MLSKNSALSLICRAETVAFSDHPLMYVIIVLAGGDSEQHIQTIQR